MNRFTKNNYTIRLVTTPYQGNEHIVGKKRLGCTYTNKCPLCVGKYRRTPYWAIGLIDREDNNFHVYRMNYEMFKRIQTFAKDPNWGDPTTYDIKLFLTFHDYDVQPQPKTALTLSDFAIKENVDKAAILKFVEPLSEDKMEKLLVLV